MSAAQIALIAFTLGSIFFDFFPNSGEWWHVARIIERTMGPHHYRISLRSLHESSLMVAKQLILEFWQYIRPIRFETPVRRMMVGSAIFPNLATK